MKSCFILSRSANCYNDWRSYQRPFFVGSHVPDRTTSKYLLNSKPLKSDVMIEEKKGVNWAKILKVVAEFITAIVTALFASSFCMPYVVQVL